MKKLIIIQMLFLCIMAFAQTDDSIECKWRHDDNLRFKYVRWDKPQPPEAWVRYPSYCLILEVCNAWRIPYGKYDLVPEYILFKNDLNTSALEACRLAYNYFMEHPNRLNYYHEDFDFVVKRVISDDR